MVVEKDKLNMTGNSDESNAESCGSPIRDADTILKKLKKLAKDKTSSKAVQRICEEARKQLKSRDEEIKFLRHDLMELKNREKELRDELKLETERKQHERDEKDHLNLYARRLACPTRLRHSMERFPMRYHYSMKQVVRDQNGIHSKLIDILESKSRVDHLTSIVLQLAEICLKKKDEQLKSFTTAYNRLRDLKYVFPSTENFGKHIYSLYEKLEPNDAFKLWENYPLWKDKSNLKKLSSADEDVIKKMTSIPVDYLLQEIENSQRDLVREKVCKPEHVEYAKACLKLKIIFQSDIPKQYKLILFILYTSPNVEIQELWNKMENEWPDEEKHERADIYVTEFIELYNLVSIVDKHGPGMLPPPMCEPSQKDYEDYCNHLSVMKNDRIKFVAQTLVL